MYWLRKSYKPDKGQFGIIGIQVAERTLYLNILVRDRADCHRYFHLYEAEVPIQLSNSSIIMKFVESLLILRNLLIVNMSLLYNALLPRSARLIEDSTTVRSP